MITVALPFLEDGKIKLQGQIRWRNNEGYGVELRRERDETDAYIRKLEAKLK